MLPGLSKIVRDLFCVDDIKDFCKRTYKSPPTTTEINGNSLTIDTVNSGSLYVDNGNLYVQGTIKGAISSHRGMYVNNTSNTGPSYIPVSQLGQIIGSNAGTWGISSTPYSKSKLNIVKSKIDDFEKKANLNKPISKTDLHEYIEYNNLLHEENDLMISELRERLDRLETKYDEYTRPSHVTGINTQLKDASISKTTK